MEHLLEVKDLSISFGGIKAVQHLNFFLDKGEVLALIGPNGSGKSTTVNMISGVYIPSQGAVYYEGKEIPDSVSIAKRAEMGISRTFQTPKPFGHLSVYDNVYTIALQRNSKHQAAEVTDEVLNLMGLYDLKEEKSGKLSIERRKWLDLARCMATKPKIIMMDEVMAGLNPSEMESSLELVRTINRAGVSILFIEHVMRAVISVCTRAIVLNEGKLLCAGEPNEVLNNPDVIAAYLGGDNRC